MASKIIEIIAKLFVFVTFVFVGLFVTAILLAPFVGLLFIIKLIFIL